MPGPHSHRGRYGDRLRFLKPELPEDAAAGAGSSQSQEQGQGSVFGGMLEARWGDSGNAQLINFLDGREPEARPRCILLYKPAGARARAPCACCLPVRRPAMVRLSTTHITMSDVNASRSSGRDGMHCHACSGIVR